MKQLKAFGEFWYDFIIGDDWHVAALVVIGLAVTAVLAHAASVNAWWLLPLVAFAALAWSLHRVTSSGKLANRIIPNGPVASRHQRTQVPV